MTDVLHRARTAFDDGTWGEAFARLTTADSQKALSTEDLERLAVAAQLIGEDEVSAAAWERAHVQLLGEGELERAVRCTFWLASGLFSRGQMARGGGWVGRGQRLILEHQLDCVEQGFLLVPAALRALEEGDPASAYDMFGEALALGRRFGEVDVVTLGRLGQGRSLILMGRADEGLALLDEAMVAVTANEVSPIVAGRVYCAVILVCQKAYDLNRAHEWTAAMSQWCARQPDLVPFRGQCLVHRSEFMQWHGEWLQALDEAKRARDRLSEPPDQPAVGLAFYQLGELYRLRGDFEDAEAAFREASRHGRPPQPGMPCLRMMQGDVEGAAVSMARVMSEPSDRAGRAKVLDAAVEIMLAAGDTAAAADAASQLAVIAARVKAPVLQAMALQADGAISLHGGHPRAALDAAQRAMAAWALLEAPYEHARSRVLAALACRDLGDQDTARLEAEAARQAFELLGAAPDVSRVDQLFAPSATSATSSDGLLSTRELEVLALVATGRANREIAECLSVSEHTVRRHVQNIFHKAGVSSRAAATAFAYEHGLL